MTTFIVGFGMTSVSCSDDNKDINKEDQQETLDPYGKKTEAGIACYNLLCQLSAVGDSLPDNWKTQTFEPLDGSVLDVSQPFVRTIVVDDMEGALEYYDGLTDKELTSARIDTWTMTDVGSLTFTPLSQTDCFATIDVKVKQLPKLTQLRLVPSSAVPDNAGFEGDPWYRLGDVIRDSEGSYWICVRPCFQKVVQSYWISFNITSTCMPDYSKSGLLKQRIPYNLGNKKPANAYAAQLLSILSRLSEFQSKYGNKPFDGEKGFSGLPDEAMSNADIAKVVSNWDQKDIWNKVKPSGMTAAEFKACFSQNLKLIFNTAHILSANLNVDISQFSDAADFYRTGQNNTDASFDMRSEIFDISSYASNGTGNSSSIGSKALVIRYKDGKSLSNTRLNMEGVSPTEPIEGTTDIYRFDASN
ncbi:MAG: hypothetical protein IJR87_00495 [Bacteroidaceae bacterium]|nr:hypothetical protein [Bacteroidaceae bacterium]